ncbi:MAG: DoxX family protein, partial [Alphaproteobacteria bacterium]|nr:DoxX family protein [Alphaproteobacteria bacterium]
NDHMARLPEGLIALVGRISIAAVFWKSGQTKIQGLAIDLVEGRFEFGVPRFADSTVELFRDEYRLPLISPDFAAALATLGEHLFPILILLGLATRVSALALLFMTLVIQVFVYPGAYPIHGVWAAVLLFLMKFGAGTLSLDHWIARRAT